MAVVFLAALAVAASGARAAELRVTSAGDSGDGVCDATCTLRDALIAANASPDSDAIRFAGAIRGAIVLTGGALPISGPVTIHGPGADALTLSGDADRSGGPSAADSRIFEIAPAAQRTPVTISGLTLAFGHSPGSGGAITVDRADLSLVDITVAKSASGAAGGGIHVGPQGRSLTIERSTVYGNAAAGDGGGIAIEGPAGGAVGISNSTIAENAAGGDGGGIYSGNPSSRPVFVANSTVARNAAAGSGGGIFRAAAGSGDGTVSLSSTIVGDNAAAGGSADIGAAPLAAGAFEAGFSLIEDPGATKLITTPVNTNSVGIDARLLPLVVSGGTTPTISPAPSSPVRDAGIANGLATDQRGFPRTARIRHVEGPKGNDRTDVGAVELRFPRVRFKGGPKRTTTRRNIRVRFTSKTPGSIFYCSYNFGEFAACDSPYRLRRLPDRFHELRVWATTPDGLRGPIARRGFVVDTKLFGPRVQAKRVQKLRRGRVVVGVAASAREDVKISALGWVKLGKGRRVPLRRSKVAVPGDTVKQFRLRPRNRRAERRIVRLAKKRGQVVARIKIRMSDRGSHRYKKGLKVKLRARGTRGNR